jgi:hypothetical protein
MLFGNNALFLRNPVRAIGGLNLSTERANWGAWGATRNFYAGDATVVEGSTIANTAGSPVGYKNPESYSWPIKDGVDQRRIHTSLTASATLAGTMVSGRNLVAILTGSGGITSGPLGFIDIRQLVSALTGSGTIQPSSMGLIVNLVSNLTGSGTISSSDLKLIYQMLSALSGASSLAGSISAIGYLTADLDGDGTLAGTMVNSPGYMFSDITSQGALLTTANVADAVWDALCEAGLTNREALRVILASAAGHLSGAPTGPIAIRNTANTKDRIVADVDGNGNRTGVTLDVSD